MNSFSNNIDEEKILEPYEYILQVRGKMVRNRLAQSFNHWMDIPSDKLNTISEIISMLHNASLLIDDIEDSSELRRGIPVAYSIFGIASTINSANYVYFLALQKALSLGHPLAAEVFCNQLLELHKGQGMEIHWRDTFVCPSEADYRRMTIRKTSGLFSLTAKLMQLFSKSTSNFSDLTDTLGLYFQIRDDYANLCMDEYSKNKTYCEDITEGKFSFPVVHAILSHPEDNQIMNILRQRTKNAKVKEYCVSLLKKYGSFEYTKQYLEKLDEEARHHINKLGGNSQLIDLLDTLKNWK